MSAPRVLLIVSGSIAACKSPELIRLLTDSGIAVRCVLSRGGAGFVTPMVLASLSGHPVPGEWMAPETEAEIGHIELARWPDLVAVCPLSANLMARMTAGMVDDLAAAVLLATDRPILAAPAMNVRMWEHAATQTNLAVLQSRGVHFVGPEAGGMACGEFGMGRMTEPRALHDAILERLHHVPDTQARESLAGVHALITAGPTREPIDPVRYLSNGSSGRQGYALALELARAGARTSLVSGPVSLPEPRHPRLEVCQVETALQMHEQVLNRLPAQIFVATAAVADWRVRDASAEKLPKTGRANRLELEENPDILASVARHRQRPALVVGFAAETGQLLERARAKREAKGCDWILANLAAGPQGAVGATDNQVIWISGQGEQAWPRLDKQQVARRLVSEMIRERAARRDAKTPASPQTGPGGPVF